MSEWRCDCPIRLRSVRDPGPDSERKRVRTSTVAGPRQRNLVSYPGFYLVSTSYDPFSVFLRVDDRKRVLVGEER